MLWLLLEHVDWLHLWDAHRMTATTLKATARKVCRKVNCQRWSHQRITSVILVLQLHHQMYTHTTLCCNKETPWSVTPFEWKRLTNWPVLCECSQLLIIPQLKVFATYISHTRRVLNRLREREESVGPPPLCTIYSCDCTNPSYSTCRISNNTSLCPKW